MKLIEVTAESSSSIDKDFQKTSKFGVYFNGVRRSKPQEIKLKKNNIGDMKFFDSVDGFIVS